MNGFCWNFTSCLHNYLRTLLRYEEQPEEYWDEEEFS